REGAASRVIAANPERIRQTILDVESQPAWRPRVAAVVRASADEWTETTVDGEAITFRRLQSDEGSVRLEFESSRGYRGEWLGRFSSAPGGGTVLEVVERATMPSPTGRILSRIFFDPAAFAAAYLDEVAREVARRDGAGA
ncbi:MAG: hypothetical protein KJS87_04565, partial [Alphaproteobacteria bacterium]|nr:hypothetical protein [Alphaproteobacteria bacterium]